MTNCAAAGSQRVNLQQVSATAYLRRSYHLCKSKLSSTLPTS